MFYAIYVIKYFNIRICVCISDAYGGGSFTGLPGMEGGGGGLSGILGFVIW